ncbi:hypothetical protein ANN_04495 [Periplaneta americana]|uniref:DUF4817 domain-containing protein n=1 Tax=Periplaneta americana TaxID=6978 RepID=A0ABQ8T8Q3_PERAM|nr:hypothetical protein ANN_04495 [Periplaneta americana]
MYVCAAAHMQPALHQSEMRLTYVMLALLLHRSINNSNKMEQRLSFKQRKVILKWYWRTENVVEIQRQWTREFGTEPPARLTIAHIRDKFETHGTVYDVYKGRSRRPRTSTSPASSAMVLGRFEHSPQKSTK